MTLVILAVGVWILCAVAAWRLFRAANLIGRRLAALPFIGPIPYSGWDEAQAILMGFAFGPLAAIAGLVLYLIARASLADWLWLQQQGK